VIVANGRHTLHVCIWANPWLDLNLHQAKLWTGRGWRRFKMHVNWQTETRRRFHPGFCNVNGRSLLLFLLPPQAPEAFEAVCSWEREGLFDAERLRGHPVEPRTPSSRNACSSNQPRVMGPVDGRDAAFSTRSINDTQSRDPLTPAEIHRAKLMSALAPMAPCASAPLKGDSAVEHHQRGAGCN